MNRNPSKKSFFKKLKDFGWLPTSIIDVGVHKYGTPDLIKAFPESHHILIEPVQEFSEPIKKLYDSCNINYTFYSIGLGKEEAELSLETKAICNDNVVSHSSLTSEINEANSSTVKVLTLDWIYRKHRTIEKENTILKIDVDGLELEILQGAKESLHHYDLIIIEMPMRTFEARLLHLISKGFQLIDIIDPTYYHGFLSQVDMVFASPGMVKENPSIEPWGKYDFSWDDYYHWRP